MLLKMEIIMKGILVNNFFKKCEDNYSDDNEVKKDK